MSKVNLKGKLKLNISKLTVKIKFKFRVWVRVNFGMRLSLRYGFHVASVWFSLGKLVNDTQTI